MKNVNKEIKVLVEANENGTLKKGLNTFVNDMDAILNGTIITLGIVALGVVMTILS